MDIDKNFINYVWKLNVLFNTNKFDEIDLGNVLEVDKINGNTIFFEITNSKLIDYILSKMTFEQLELLSKIKNNRGNNILMNISDDILEIYQKYFTHEQMKNLVNNLNNNYSSIFIGNRFKLNDKIVTKLLKYVDKEILNKLNIDGNNILVHIDDVNLIQIYINNGLDVNMKINEKTILFVKYYNLLENIVIYDNDKPNKTFEDFIKEYKNDYDIIKCLIDMGANYNDCDKYMTKQHGDKIHIKNTPFIDVLTIKSDYVFINETNKILYDFITGPLASNSKSASKR